MLCVDCLCTAARAEPCQITCRVRYGAALACVRCRTVRSIILGAEARAWDQAGGGSLGGAPGQRPGAARAAAGARRASPACGAAAVAAARPSEQPARAGTRGGAEGAPARACRAPRGISRHRHDGLSCPRREQPHQHAGENARTGSAAMLGAEGLEPRGLWWVLARLCPVLAGAPRALRAPCGRLAGA
ncbi:MAG: hypothetical protein J3K34DRAFT_443549 [Monoraphidium minutum]|nr:MAG: hypothetical protein J3K34DRAFT_443549 [Monoraphidium minutum]